MMKRKYAIFSLIAIFAVLILIFVLMGRGEEKINSEGNKFVSNTGVVYGQGSSLLEYNDCTYMLNATNSALIRYDYKTNSLVNIHTASENSFSDRMYIINNKLIYTVDKITYYCNLDGTSRTTFFKGEILYINDDIYVYLLQREDFLQHLYIVSYNNQNFRRAGDLEYNLAKGKEINFLRKSEDVLIFSSVNSDASSSLFLVDVANYKSKLIVRENPDGSKLEIVDAIKDDEDIFYVLSITAADEVTSNNLYFAPIEGRFTELQDTDVGDKVYELPVKENGIVYEKFSNDEYVLRDIYDYYTDIEFFDVVYGEITKFFKYRDSSLYLSDSKLVTIEQGYDEYSLDSVKYVNNRLYFSLKKGSMYAYFSCNKDGSELKKIY